MKKFILLPTILALAACAPSTLHLTDPVAAQESVKCSYDSFAKQKNCRAATVSTPDRSALDVWSPSAAIELIAIFPDKGDVVIVMEGRIAAREWFFPERILDNNGQELPMSKDSSEIVTCGGGACFTAESVKIAMTKKYLSDHSKDGFSIKIYGQRGTVIIDVPAAYIQGFLKFVANNK